MYYAILPPTLLSGMNTLEMVLGQVVTPEPPLAKGGLESVWKELVSVEAW